MPKGAISTIELPQRGEACKELSLCGLHGGTEIVLGAGTVSQRQSQTRGEPTPPQERQHREPEQRERATWTGESNKFKVPITRTLDLVNWSGNL